MEEVASEEEVQMEAVQIGSVPENRRVVSMECPLQAYKVIVHHCHDLDYIRKLAALLDNVSKIMN